MIQTPQPLFGGYAQPTVPGIVLHRDFSSWGNRFPAAKGEAEKILGRLPQLRRTWLMDLYLFPPIGVRRELADTLTFYPTETDR